MLDPDHEPQKLLCHVEQFTFSGHATRETICACIERVTPKKTILVHGDQPALAAGEIIKPQPGVQFEF